MELLIQWLLSSQIIIFKFYVMIQYVKGDLLRSDAEALVNTVNTVGVMGKGIALQFREAFPDNYKIYRKICKQGNLHIGQMLVTEETSLYDQKKIIINFPTKTHWKYSSEYSYIEKGLVALRDEIEKRNIKSVAIPPLGSHNGGLDWQRVRTMIEEILVGLKCDVYLYEPSDKIVARMKSERVKLTAGRALLLLMLADLTHEGEFASVFAAEKLIYFMQRFGAEDLFKINFKPYFYGPYSGGKVSHVLHYLNGSYLKGMSSMDNRPFDYIWLTDDAEEEAQKFFDRLNDENLVKVLDHTKKFLRGFYSNYTLELLSSVDYLLENNSLLCNWRDSNDETVIEILVGELQKWSSRKGQMFKQEHLQLALSHIKATPSL